MRQLASLTLAIASVACSHARPTPKPTAFFAEPDPSCDGALRVAPSEQGPFSRAEPTGQQSPERLRPFVRGTKYRITGALGETPGAGKCGLPEIRVDKLAPWGDVHRCADLDSENVEMHRAIGGLPRDRFAREDFKDGPPLPYLDAASCAPVNVPCAESYARAPACNGKTYCCMLLDVE